MYGARERERERCHKKLSPNKIDTYFIASIYAIKAADGSFCYCLKFSQVFRKLVY